MKKSGMKQLVFIFLGLMMLSGVWATGASASTAYYVSDSNGGTYYFGQRDWVYTKDNDITWRVYYFDKSDYLSYGLITFNTNSGLLSIKIFENTRYTGYSLEANSVDFYGYSKKVKGYYIDRSGTTYEQTISVGNFQE
ncbi:MAG: hypothetical protein HQK73_07310 [Desulfamplus sp.]|nr:hypothetical protein [Desulfamplus sp.]MBF0413280.1 hypothetical protein [Desulfamplus sp.]